MFNLITKLTISIIVSSCLLMTTPQVMAADKIIKQTQTHNVFKGFLLSIWGRFKTFNPHNKQIAKSSTVYTAGIRGAESTGTLLQPYWKDDLTNDPVFQKELKMYGKALTYMDNGNLKEANKALGKFLSTYPSSSLKPNALFAQGISYAGIGNSAKASSILKQFIKDYSAHPLAVDAKDILKKL